MFYVFYAGLLYGEYTHPIKAWLRELPNGAYIYFPEDQEWRLNDLTPVLLEDVPKELRLQVLLLT